MAYSITSDMTLIDDAADATNWSSSLAIAPSDEVFIEGAASVGITKVSQAVVTTKFDYYTEKGYYYNASTSPTHLYFWVNVSNGGGLDTAANGGVRIYMEDNAGAYVEWYVAGSDTYSGGWRCFVAYTDAAADYSYLSIDKTQIQYFGVTVDMIAKTTANVHNVWIDVIRYGSKLICSGTDTSQMTWDDVLAGDETGTFGVIRKAGGIFFVQGAITFGDSVGTNATDFSDANQVIVFEDAKVSSTLYNITVVGNATGDTDFQMGTKSGTAGISGCILRAEGTAKYDFTATSTAIEDLLLYGCTFYDADVVSLPTYSASAPLREVLNCNFEACNEVDPDTCTVTNCNFINADDRGCRIDTTSHHVTDSNFIACPDAVHIPTADTYTFSSLVFTNNTFDVENSSAGVVNINVSGTGAASSAENTGGGSTNFLSSVDIDVHVEDTGGTDIQYAQVYVQKSASGKEWNYTSHATLNVVGGTTFEVVEVVDTDLPQSGWLHVWDASSNTKQNYRYTSWTGKIFSLQTEVTYACTGGGTGVLLQDSGHDFTALEIEEGDTVRNTTDGSWAVVDEITDASNITTTQLQDGFDNTWTSGDTYSFHKLAILYNTNDKVDIPLFNGQTDATGDISGSYNWGAIGAVLPIKVRIRSNQGSTKYIPFNTSGSITGDGYSLTAVPAEDDVAT